MGIISLSQYLKFLLWLRGLYWPWWCALCLAKVSSILTFYGKTLKHKQEPVWDSTPQDAYHIAKCSVTKQAKFQTFLPSSSPLGAGFIWKALFVKALAVSKYFLCLVGARRRGLISPRERHTKRAFSSPGRRRVGWMNEARAQGKGATEGAWGWGSKKGRSQDRASQVPRVIEQRDWLDALQRASD